MSDAIGGSGGGGGGGGFDIQGLIGSIGGLLGQGKGGEQKGGSAEGTQKQGGGLQSMLDPLGLFPMLGALIGQTNKGVNANEITAAGKFENNEIAEFQKSQKELKAPADNPAKTDYVTKGDLQKIGDGYAPRDLKDMSVAAQEHAVNAMNNAHEPGRLSQDSKATAVHVDSQGRATSESRQTAAQQENKQDERTTSAQAQTGVVTVQTPEQLKRAAELKEEKKHLEYILSNYRTEFETGATKDGNVDAADLRLIASQGFTPEARAAAQYLLDRPELMSSLMSASGGGNGLINSSAIKARVDALIGMTQNPVIQSTDPVGGPGGPGGPGDTNGTGPATAKPAKTLHEALGNIADDIEKKQTEIAAGGKSPEQTAMMNQELEKLVMRFQQMYQLLNNLRKSFHDMSMHSIGYIGR